MKSTILLSALAVMGASATLVDVSHEIVLNEFVGYISSFNKNYSNDNEIRQRFENFSKNYKHAAQLNLDLNNGDVNGTKKAFGVTMFSDMTQEEMASYTNYKPSSRSADGIPSSVSEFISDDGRNFTSYDWRDKGYVTNVVNQLKCGSCWAFSAAFGVESAFAMKMNGIHPSMHFSPQQLVDCENISHGCDGGDLPPAYNYLRSNGMALWRDYPYTGTDNTCTYSPSKKFTNVTGFKWVIPPCDGRDAPSSCDQQNILQMQKQISLNGPAAVCVHVDDSWFYYTGPEPYTAPCQRSYYSLNHCVGIVGYRADTSVADAEGYWIVKNSWGEGWGIKGYMHIPSSTSTSSKYNNYCGLASEATFVTL